LIDKNDVFLVDKNDELRDTVEFFDFKGKLEPKSGFISQSNERSYSVDKRNKAR